MDKLFEYYRIHRKNDNSIPLLVSDSGNPDYLYTEEFIETPELMKFRFAKPIPRKPKMADYHSCPSSVISKKIYDILNPLKINFIQFLPAQIKGTDEDDIHTNYWAIHVYKYIECVDQTLSNCLIDGVGLKYVKKIILNKEILKLIPLNERLIFRLKEDFGYQLYHVSVVEKILSQSPAGVSFTNIEAWNESSFFNN
jgi:hypothetical protein